MAEENIKKTNTSDISARPMTSPDDSRKFYQEIMSALSKFAAASAASQQKVAYFPAEQLHQVIRASRTKQKLTQKELASLASISIGTMVALENGKRTAGFDTVERVLKALGLHLWIR